MTRLPLELQVLAWTLILLAWTLVLTHTWWQVGMAGGATLLTIGLVGDR